jgi:hypothetical protein
MHLIFPTCYRFYELSEPERIKLIGRCFKESLSYKRKKNGKAWKSETIYFIVGLRYDQFNYGKNQGLIHVTDIWQHPNEPAYFNVGATSPDDLDCQVSINDATKSIRNEVIKFLRNCKHTNVTYKEIILKVHEKFGGDIDC